MDSTELRRMLLDDSIPDSEKVVIARNLADSATIDDLEFLKNLTTGKDNMLRKAAIEGLGAFTNLFGLSNIKRDVYDMIFPHLTDNDSEIRRCAILALGELINSRALFPLVNIYRGGNEQTRSTVLQALKSLGDPRSVDFLKSISDSSDFARSIADEIDVDETYFYDFNGSEIMYRDSHSMNGQVVINSFRNLDSIDDILAENDFSSRPQTYIVTPNWKFVVGGTLQEHVYVARGTIVPAAGEVRFIKEGGQWRVLEINNRSNGYHPGKSYYPVRKALEKTGINHPDNFTEIFPKDGYFTDDFLNLQPLAGYED